MRPRRTAHVRRRSIRVVCRGTALISGGQVDPRKPRVCHLVLSFTQCYKRYSIESTSEPSQRSRPSVKRKSGLLNHKQPEELRSIAGAVVRVGQGPPERTKAQAIGMWTQPHLAAE